MPYMVFMNSVMLPVTPGKIEMKYKSNNKTVNLIDDGDINIPKTKGLVEISFEALLPRRKYPFSSPIHLDPQVYLTGLEALKTLKKPFQFIVVRTLPKSWPLFPTNIKCVLEDYTVIEDSKNGLDVVVKIQLKQYKGYGLKEVKITETSNGNPTASVEPPRSAETAPANSTHTVQKGESLWNISKKELGDGSRWKEIYNLNKDKITNPDLIFPDQVLTLPK